MPETKKFRDMTPAERLQALKDQYSLTDEECAVFSKTGSLDLDKANGMIENVIGTAELPLGIATNFLVDGEEYHVPMTLEEPSVVAAASFAAKLCLPEGFRTRVDKPEMIGEIQVIGVKDMKKAIETITANKNKIMEMCNEKDKILVKFGGGARDVSAYSIRTKRGEMLIVHLIVDVRDAMGANAINTMAEVVSPFIEEITKGKVRLRIITNLATRRIARAEAVWKKSVIGPEAVEGILDAYEFAANDIYRCATHNKGVMNGIDAVVIATGNDWRAVEAGMHAYAAYDTSSANGYGKYHPITKYSRTPEGDLKGEIELPIALGTVGGAIKINKTAQVSLKILKNPNAQRLAGIVASVGLAQNFAALRALSTEGIQRGHMRLHAKNIAITAGAQGDDVEKIAQKMIEEMNINVTRAKELLEGK